MWNDSCRRLTGPFPGRRGTRRRARPPPLADRDSESDGAAEGFLAAAGGQQDGVGDAVAVGVHRPGGDAAVGRRLERGAQAALLQAGLAGEDNHEQKPLAPLLEAAEQGTDAVGGRRVRRRRWRWWRLDFESADIRRAVDDSSQPPLV